jgi:pyruvate/2-oxoglutarate dehydrogenase complex dihydrolipoamide acyltransferase (E2) component
MPKENKYQIRKYSPVRRILADFNNVAASLNRVYGLIEIDVTDALAKMEEIEKKKKYKVSMTGWMSKCVSQAVMENKHLNSFRKGRRKIIIFDEVDISIIVEITTKEGKKVPYNYVIRNVETKSVKTITDEIRSYQNKKIDEQEQLARGSSRNMSFFAIFPRFFRRFVIRKMFTTPKRMKKLVGTVGITSLGMFIKGQGAYAIPFPGKTCNIAIGSIKDQVALRNGKIEERKILCTTFLIDHDLVDGAPATRFIARLSTLMGETTYLDDLDKI